MMPLIGWPTIINCCSKYLELANVHPRNCWTFLKWSITPENIFPHSCNLSVVTYDVTKRPLTHLLQLLIIHVALMSEKEPVTISQSLELSPNYLLECLSHHPSVIGLFSKTSNNQIYVVRVQVDFLQQPPV